MFLFSLWTTYCYQMLYIGPSASHVNETNHLYYVSLTRGPLDSKCSIWQEYIVQSKKKSIATVVQSETLVRICNPKCHLLFFIFFPVNHDWICVTHHRPRIDILIVRVGHHQLLGSSSPTSSIATTSSQDTNIVGLSQWFRYHRLGYRPYCSMLLVLLLHFCFHLPSPARYWQHRCTHSPWVIIEPGKSDMISRPLRFNNIGSSVSSSPMIVMIVSPFSTLVGRLTTTTHSMHPWTLLGTPCMPHDLATIGISYDHR